MKLALLLVLLTVNIFAFNLFVNEPSDVNDDKVKIDFYYESLCPYCAQFMEGSLKTAAATKVFLASFRICGRFATSDSSPTEMPAQPRLAMMTTTSPASMEPDNAKAT